MLRVVLPFCNKDVKQMADLLRFSIELDTVSCHKCLLSYEEGTEASEIRRLAESFFREGVEEYSYTTPRTTEWPEAPNWAWTRAAIHIGGLKEKLPWLWMEPDVLPLVSGWLDKIEIEYVLGGLPIMGHIVRKQRGISEVTGKPIFDEHFNGVAVYPANARDLSVSAMRTRVAPWDVVMARECLGLCHKANDLIAHVPRYNGVILHCNDSRVVDFIIAKGAVILHGCNDGSVLQLMRGKKPDQPPEDRVVKVITHEDFNGSYNESEALWQHEAIELKKKGHQCLEHKLVQIEQPSFRDQTEFRTGIVHWLEYSQKCVHLNPGICSDDSGNTWLLTRRWERWSPIDAPYQNWHSTIQVHKIILKEHSIENAGSPVTLDFKSHPNVEHEDPRIIFHDGKFYLSYCTWERYRRTAHGRQGFAVFDKDWNLISNEIPKYGKNYLDPDKQQERDGGDPKPVWEKNWKWFFHKGHWRCIYSFSPFTVFTYGRHIPEPCIPEPKIWKHGTIRGGTPPIRHDGLYWTFFHSALPWKYRQRRYYMGAYAFNDHLEIVRITPEPIISGSERDNRMLKGPLVIFPCGALVENGNSWRVVFGVNDEQCGWISIPHGKLLERTTECSQSVT